ncbi:DMT family transporter [Sphingomonas sp. 10B4]|uniref:DMT family transporter n=1 Tax=Sphingomonas sp. 10B4 TaxID=3048575 RepID=UPI002AB3482E|nr:DMT family transporter [Sphingomonas sp. 10B4]MDY7524049.1 DMT family transporter [Sphingomonas sp. 10B4]MEB0281667.1 DMT family transporter [Sphingomonas sp. 10B4]
MHPRSPKRKSVAAETAVLPLLALIVANAALAFGPWFVRLADTGPIASAFWRITLAAPILAGAALATGWRPREVPRALWGIIAIGGLCFAADLGSWHLGILRTTLANATLFGNSATLMFPLYGFLVARAWPTRVQGVALGLATIGAGLLMGRSYQLDPRHLAGDLLCLTAGILYTGYFILMARARATMAPLPALALSTLASVLPLLGFALAMGEKILPTDWTPLIGLALVSQIIGQGLMIYALGRLPPLTVGLGLLTQPVVAGTIGWIVYGERLGLPDLVGAVLVAIALVLVSRRPRA